ncbi:MAG: hypothetical protein J6N70_19285 [Oribacterium sp.]|nr:hypothetical protein [Oribacterium sp.]
MNSAIKGEKNSIKIKQYSPNQVACIVIAMLSVMISFLLIPYHELWRDEPQAWLIARDTPLKDLFLVLKHEGHPALWFLILMPFAKIGLPAICLNYISWFFTTIAVFVIAFKSPFHIVTKFFTLLSPMFVYWYPVVSRSYAPVSCLLSLLAVLYPKRRQKPILYGILLFCLINLHLMSAGIVGGILLIDVWEILKEYREKKQIIWKPYIGTLVGIFGCILMVLQLLGSPDTGNWNISIRNNPDLIQYRMYSMFFMFFPIFGHKDILAALGVILFAFHLLLAFYLFVCKQRGALIIYLFEILFIWYILLFVMPSGQKPYLLFSTFLFVLWILPRPIAKPDFPKKITLYHRTIHIILTLLFVIMCITGYPNTLAYDIREPYSMGKATAEYLNQTCTDQDILIFLDNAYEPSVTAYLNRNLRVWDIAEGDYQSFPLWSPERSEINYLLAYLYDTVVENNTALGIDGYTGSGMNDFLQSYINQCFPVGTSIYFVLTSEMAELYDLENDNTHYDLRARFNGECKYSSESFSVYHFVSGL